jgi:hypothetical protein
MKTTILSGITVLFFASSAFAGSTLSDVAVSDPVVLAPRAPVVGGSINVEVTENASGNWVAATTLGAGIEAEGLAFGSIAVEAVDGEFDIDSWMIGTNIGTATLSFGDQGDLFVGNDFEIVGGDTLAAPADDHESLIAEFGSAAVLVGFTDITSDVTDIENIQGSYTLASGQIVVTAVGDYNLNSEDWTLGSKANMKVGQVALGGIVTYGSATETFGYEASAGYSFATAFVNGDDSDMLQNVGAGVAYDFNGLNLYAEGTYNLDAETTAMGAGITFKF